MTALADLDFVRGEIEERMDEIGRYFKAGALVTVLIRFEKHPNRDLILTSDTIPELIEMLKRHELTS